VPQKEEEEEAKEKRRRGGHLEILEGSMTTV